MHARTRRNRSLSLYLSLGVALLALAPAAFGAVAPYRGQHDQDKAPLRGPRVEHNRAPGANAPFTKGMTDRRMRAPRIPNEVFLRALRSLAADDVPKSLRLTGEQEQKLRRLAERHRERAQAFREQHAEGLQRLEHLRNSPNARQRAQRLAPEQRRRLRDLAESAPKADAVHTRMWSILNDTQREALHEHLGQAMQKHRAQRENRSERAPRAQRSGQRSERADRQHRAQRAPRADRIAPQERRQRAQRRRGAADDERTRVLWSRIENLPPRARMRLLDRLEKGLERIEADRIRADKPAPSMDEVDVPPADDP